MKFCSVCKQMKATEEFSKDASKSDGLQSKCKYCQKQLSHIHYLNNKEKYADVHNRHKEARRNLRDASKNKPCADCNILYPPWIMQFDHVRGTKQFVISEAMFNTPKRQLLEEIEKCDVVCANCHAHRSFTRITKHNHLK